MTPEDRDIEIADYLADELSPDARMRFEERMADDPELRHEVEGLSVVSRRISRAAVDPVDDKMIEAPALTLPVEDIPPGRGERRRSRRLAPALVAVATFAIAAAVVVAVVLTGGDSDDSGSGGVESSIALRPIDTAPETASGSLQSESNTRRAVLQVSGLFPNDAGDYYEAWLISDDQRRLLPLGSFAVGDNGEASVDIELPANAAGFRFFDISLEPDDGDPDHSGVSVLRGPAPRGQETS